MMNANEQFIVKHYSEDERPILKGHGFDGLTIGDDRQEAQEFVDYLNTMLRQQQSEIEALKAKTMTDEEIVAHVPLMAWELFSSSLFRLEDNEITNDEFIKRCYEVVKARCNHPQPDYTQFNTQVHPFKTLTDEEIYQAIRRGFSREGFLSDGIFLEIKELLRNKQGVNSEQVPRLFLYGK